MLPEPPLRRLTPTWLPLTRYNFFLKTRQLMKRFFVEDALLKGTLTAQKVQLGLDGCTLTAVTLLSKDNLVYAHLS